MSSRGHFGDALTMLTRAALISEKNTTVMLDMCFLLLSLVHYSIAIKSLRGGLHKLIDLELMVGHPDHSVVG